MARQDRIQIVYRRLDELLPDINNPRVNDEAVEPVMSSILNFGMRIPIVIDKFNNIVAGHTRYKACKRLYIDRVPCIVADKLTPKQLKAYELADNKTGQKATWNTYMLQAQMSAVEALFDMSSFGFKPKSPTEQKQQEQYDTQLQNGKLMCPKCGCTFTKEEADKAVW